MKKVKSIFLDRNNMKVRLIIQSLFVFLLLCCYPIVTNASFKEIWKEKVKHPISKLLSVDLNKNGINEILLLSGEKKIQIIEWDKDTFVIRLQQSEFKAGADFEYYDFSESLRIEEFNPVYSQEYDRLSKCRMSLLRSFPPN